MDYLDFEFYYKGKKSLLDFKNKNITDRLNGVDDVTSWSGYVKMDEKKIYFQNCWFWYIIMIITDTLKEREAFIKLSLQCKTRTYYQFLF